MDTVSVIVPIYNVEKYLVRCIQSILSQTYSNLEIILVDDGSRDNSPQICDQLAVQEPRIKVIHQENQGQGYARNTGLKHATGEFVIFVDSDDYIGEEHVEKLYESMIKTNADIAVGFYIAVNEKGEIIKKKSELITGEYERERVFSELLLPLIGTDETCRSDTVVEPSACMSMYRHSLIKNHGIWFNSVKVVVAEDQFFNIDCFMHAQKVVVTDINDYYYFMNSQSTTRKHDKGRFARTVNYYNLLIQRVNQYGISELAERRVARSFLMKTRIALRLIAFSDMDFLGKRAEIKRILSHDLLVKVIREYPIYTYPFMMRVLSQLMRRKSATGVYFLIKARDYMKKR